MGPGGRGAALAADWRADRRRFGVLSAALRPWLALAGAACVLAAASELVFFNEGVAGALLEGPVAGRIAHLAQIVLFYLLLAGVWAAALSAFPTGSLAGLFLAGCLFGWAAEGVFVPVVYEAIPYSFLWTSVAWHAVVDVMLFAILLPRVLRSGPAWTAPVALAGAGLFWGVWTSWIWVDGLVPGLGEFAVFAGLTFLILGPGLAILTLHGGALFTLPRVAVVAFAVAALALAGLQGIAVPLGFAALMGLVAVTLAGLRRVARAGPPPPEPPAPDPRRLAWLPVLPAAAVAGYAATLSLGTGVAVGEVAFFAMLGGGAAWIAAMWRAFTAR